MSSVFGLLLMLVGASQGVAKPCDGRQNKSICYGALGGSVLLQLMDDASEKPRFQWKNESMLILNGWRGRLVAYLPDKFSFNFKNGTVRIDNLSRLDGGEYILLLFDSNGKTPVRQTLQLIIQAPVSSVQLVTECLSQGEMKVTCSSEGGDSPQYSWTLNGQKLEESKLYFGNHETKNITLNQEVSGELVCTVRNDVSSVQEKKEISTCGFTFFDCILTNGTYIKQWLQPTNETLCIEPTTTPEGKETDVTVTNKPSNDITTYNNFGMTSRQQQHINSSLFVCGLKAAAILIIIAIFLCFAWKKNKLMKAGGSAVFEEVEYENTSAMVEMRSPSAEP